MHGHTGTFCGRPSTYLRVRTYCLYLFHGTAKGLGWLAGTTRAVRASRDAMLCLLLVLRCVAYMTELLLSVPVACDTRSAPMSQPVRALPCEIGMPPLLKELVSGCQKGDAKVFTPSLCAQATSAIIEHWAPHGCQAADELRLTEYAGTSAACMWCCVYLGWAAQCHA